MLQFSKGTQRLWLNSTTVLLEQIPSFTHGRGRKSLGTSGEQGPLDDRDGANQPLLISSLPKAWYGGILAPDSSTSIPRVTPQKTSNKTSPAPPPAEKLRSATLRSADSAASAPRWRWSLRRHGSRWDPSSRSPTSDPPCEQLFGSNG